MNKALFLDRDGVINQEIKGTVTEDNCVFIPQIFEIGRYAKKKGYKIIVVTNQGGIAYGFNTINNLERFHTYLAKCFEKRNCPLTAIYYCPFHPTGTVKEYAAESPMRKPLPGMLLKAAEDHSIDLSNSIMVGDRFSDMQAGVAAGVRTNLLVNLKDECPDGFTGPYIHLKRFSSITSFLA